jgi:acyl carrier protein
VRERLARYIATDLLNQGDLVIADDEDLLASGLLDSLSVMSLIHFIEQDLSIDVPAEDVTIENFVSLRAIDAYLARRLEAAKG